MARRRRSWNASNRPFGGSVYPTAATVASEFPPARPPPLLLWFFCSSVL
jgi:hypothetical protein